MLKQAQVAIESEKRKRLLQILKTRFAEMSVPLLRRLIKEELGPIAKAIES